MSLVKCQRFILPVLLFHSVEPGTPELYNVPPSQFRNIIHFIASEFRPLSLNDVVRKLQTGQVTAKNEILVTFDDGYRNTYLHARAVLLKHHVPAVFFILPTKLNKTNIWNPKCDYIRSHLRTKELQTLVQDGFTIGSHGISHHSLVKFPRQRIRSELRESRSKLEEIIGQEVRWFAYPYGVFNNEVLEEARKVYELVFATDIDSCSNWRERNFGAIKRVYVWPSSTEVDVYKSIVEY